MYKYEDLVQLVKEREQVQHKGKLTIVEKRIPDSDAIGELDPRVYQINKNKGANKQSEETGEISIAALRAKMGWKNLDLTKGSIHTESKQITGRNGEIPIRIYSNKNGTSKLKPGVIFFHGGGFIGGTVDVVENPMKSLAEKADAVVVNVDYRLAPEHPFPAGLMDCYDTVQWIHSHAEELGIDSNCLTVAGDSAGGNLATGCAILDRNEGKHYIKYQALIYPALMVGTHENLDWSYDAYTIHNHEEFIRSGIEGIRNSGPMFNQLYLTDGHKPTEDLVSPLLCDDLSKLPEALIVAAEYDFLRIEEEKYAHRLAESGVTVRYVNYKGMDHAFIDKYGIYPQAEDCINEIAAGIQRIQGI